MTPVSRGEPRPLLPSADALYLQGRTPSEVVEAIYGVAFPAEVWPVLREFVSRKRPLDVWWPIHPWHLMITPEQRDPEVTAARSVSIEETRLFSWAPNFLLLASVIGAGPWNWRALIGYDLDELCAGRTTIVGFEDTDPLPEGPVKSTVLGTSLLDVLRDAITRNLERELEDPDGDPLKLEEHLAWVKAVHREVYGPDRTSPPVWSRAEPMTLIPPSAVMYEQGKTSREVMETIFGVDLPPEAYLVLRDLIVQWNSINVWWRMSPWWLALSPEVRGHNKHSGEPTQAAEDALVFAWFPNVLLLGARNSAFVADNNAVIGYDLDELRAGRTTIVGWKGSWKVPEKKKPYTVLGSSLLDVLHDGLSSELECAKVDTAMPRRAPPLNAASLLSRTCNGNLQSHAESRRPMLSRRHGGQPRAICPHRSPPTHIILTAGLVEQCAHRASARRARVCSYTRAGRLAPDGCGSRIARIQQTAIALVAPHPRSGSDRSARHPYRLAARGPRAQAFDRARPRSCGTHT